MRAVIQRVTSARCRVSNETTGAISTGLLVLLGVENGDTREDMEWLAGKIAGMRIFSDAGGLMNRSLAEVDGGILLISQFTLFASTKKGNRPGFTRAAAGGQAKELYGLMAQQLEAVTGKTTQLGIFGADMQVDLVNDGPVTIIIDSRQRE